MYIKVREVEVNSSLAAFSISQVFNVLELKIRANMAKTVLVHQRKHDVNNTWILTLQNSLYWIFEVSESHLQLLSSSFLSNKSRQYFRLFELYRQACS